MLNRNDSNAGDIEGVQGSSSTPSSKAYLKVAPDGGWGWIIVFGSFLVHCLIDGVTYAFGVYTPDIVDFYGVSRQSVGWVNSILVGVTFASGNLSVFAGTTFA